ncbi:hypothetical protein T440DRAFT_522781 [Plenodomus tracheiphilus IPT5]|uniref:Uncharacterized protein n=1 Tax=Plenodomus tracheiphilus IPT5 TaxID=1408161 RepID=A0A6A7APP0_9PLEO|nr:hypothetical protein T440DRAFT_522781 [Plenodomus tracheiphilus IPT5]
MSFYLPRANPPLQIIQYGGPPMPKQTSRRNPTKAPSGQNSPKSNTEMENNEDPAPASDAVEVIDLTCSVGERGSEVNGSGHGREGDVGSYDDFVCQNENDGEEYMRIFREYTDDESPNQPAPSGDISQENTVVVEDSQSSLDTDSGDSYKDDAPIQKGDRLGFSNISTLECHGRVHNGAGPRVADLLQSGQSAY